MNNSKTIYYIYQTTNLINGKIYIGKGNSRYPDRHKYLGSGKLIKRAIKKYGKQSFKKDILFKFDTEPQAYEKEKQIVNEQFINRKDTYNMVVGGKRGTNAKRQQIRTKISKSRQGKVSAYNKNGKYVWVSKKQFDSNNDLVGLTKNKVLVTDDTGFNFYVSKDDERLLSGSLRSIHCNNSLFKDSDGNIVYTSINDKRVLNGQIVGITKGTKQSKESNQKRSISCKNSKCGESLKNKGKCPHCGIETTIGNLYRWHLDNCKHKNN